MRRPAAVPGRSRHGVQRDRAALDSLPAPPGLCATCVHCELVGSRSSVFVRCALSDRDPRFPRYPALPVRRCTGFEEGGER
jgi:hypothetical protein